MKKRLVKTLWGMAVVALLLTGCGKKEVAEPIEDTLVEAAVETEAETETTEDEELSEQEQQDIEALKEQFDKDREYNFAGIDESQLNVGDNAENEDEADAEDAVEEAPSASTENVETPTENTQTQNTAEANATVTEPAAPSASTTPSQTENSTATNTSGNNANNRGDSNTNNTTSNTTPTEPSHNTDTGNGSNGSGSTAHTHSYQTVSVAATCTTAGYTEERCSCGDVRNHTDIPADGHYYEEHWFLQPTCTKDGYVDYVCSKCGAVDESRSGSGEMLPHTVAERVVYEGDCRTNKTIEQYCTVCGTVTGTREEPGAEVHDWQTRTDEVWDDDAFAMVEITTTRCDRCGKFQE